LDKLKSRGSGGHSPASTACSWAQSQASLHEICGGKSISETYYFPCTLDFLCQYHYTNFHTHTHTHFIHQPSMLHNLSNWQYH